MGTSTRQIGAVLRRPHGFTLLELLVVAALLIVAAALLMPALSGAKRLQDQVGCAGELRHVGLAAIAYATDSFGRLPAHHANPYLPFDTFVMVPAHEDAVNLGLLTDYVAHGRTFYCPTQTEATSAALAFDTQENRWLSDAVQGARKGKGKGKAKGHAKGNGQGNDQDQGQGERAEDLNSSFAARARGPLGTLQSSWTIRNYGNKAIYSDFTGVDGWSGTGRFAGSTIVAPHGGTGYNRLFGDGSVQWIDGGRLTSRRPVNALTPTDHEMHEYYRLLDVLP